MAGSLFVAGGCSSIFSAAGPLVNSMSFTGQSSLMVVYATYRASFSYTGPTFQLRRSNDSAVVNFYADSNGNLGQSVGGTGVSLASWLGTSTAYVAVWYDQSGNGRHATQTTTSLQPIYSMQFNFVDFKTSAWMNMPTSSVPSGDGVYSWLARHNNIYNSNGGIFGIGNNANLQSINPRCNGGSNYCVYWYGNDICFGSYAIGNIVAETYDLSNRRAYVNGVLQLTQASSSRNGGRSIGYLGATTNDAVIDGELFYLFTSSMVLSSSDLATLTSSTETMFYYTGGVQTYVVPAGVTALYIDMAGAQGGNDDSLGNIGGYGGRITTYISVTAGQTLYVLVAGKGSGGACGTSVGGWNGGAASTGNGCEGAGGGASDIRTTSSTVSSRLVVAGGGGGAGCSQGGGAGGGLTAVGGSGSSPPAGGGTQTSGGTGNSCSCTTNTGTLGYGGTSVSSCEMSGGGGGGYYGGGSDSCQGSGGGGSSYSSGTNTAHTQGYQAGNGYVMIVVSGCSSASANASGASCPSFPAPTANPTPSPTSRPTAYPTLSPTPGFNAVYLATIGDNSNRAMTLVEARTHTRGLVALSMLISTATFTTHCKMAQLPRMLNALLVIILSR